ncbi:MAG: alpha/beta fold hydrolase [Cyanobacteriota bacterium]|nr:alpha/beta fold hydrolase [Cyanobacteriota bacterium]
MRVDLADGQGLLAYLDQPALPAQALVLLVHGLGGSSSSPGLRRLAAWLRRQGLAVLRLNLRGAGEGRSLAVGTYAAACNRDLLPALAQARKLAAELQPGPGPRPLLAVGLSLGGTVLVNGLLESGPEALDGLVLISSPLDLSASCDAIEQPRNWLYQTWLLRRLLAQTLADPAGLSAMEHGNLAAGVTTIRRFDDLITAPRWGHGSAAEYHASASPLAALVAGTPLPPTLVLHAADDPWVPAAATRQLAVARAGDPSLQVLITPGGGHNGFHGRGDPAGASWSDRLATHWLLQRCSQWVERFGAPR